MENLALNWFKRVSQKLVLNKYHYKFARVVAISKKESAKRPIFITNLYDRIVQKAVYRALSVTFEGYSYWEKTDKNKVKADYCEVIDHTQIVKKKG
jgi:hypothetical protein